MLVAGGGGGFASAGSASALRFLEGSDIPAPKKAKAKKANKRNLWKRAKRASWVLVLVGQPDVGGSSSGLGGEFRRGFGGFLL